MKKIVGILLAFIMVFGAAACNIQNPNGNKGDKGDKGDTGLTGDTGLSAYETYIKYHPKYQGDEEQWIDDLVNGRLKDKEEWTNDEAVNVIIAPAYVDEVLQDVDAAFKFANVKKVLIIGKSINLSLDLLLILKKGGEANQSAAIQILRADERVLHSSYYWGVPYEDINTLKLSAPANTVVVGNTLAIDCEGYYSHYRPYFEFGVICVDLKNYNPQKEYGPADFPQVQLASVWVDTGSWYEFGHRFYLTLANLTLVKDGFYDTINAINALARDPEIAAARLRTIEYPEVDPPQPYWVISDTSVVEFVGDSVYDGIFYGDTVVIKGLKPGGAVITYVYGYGICVSCIITVIDLLD